ncbi:LysR family transcriptional regulator [Rivibacter subsaxonicus]|uniref:LysR family transcriptional regulator n=1 Tax=Rivibacter subsaxonicus TaxID=457575 RepID=A0A4Q7W085_9BURK|nr:LysR family transcriptional regulator [Rivibacter subsaxonicus]RZU02403.1 LysR family transcriptional regulator [Rivibacter subsaxonicus]
MDRITGIELFIRVVETGSFSKAAEELRIAQPTATKHVAALEQRLGARLLHRSTRGVSPTEVGQLYYDKCKAIARDLEEADNVAQLAGAGMAGTLRVSTSVAFGRRVLTPLVLAFMREHPQLLVDLSFDDRYVNLVEQGVDVALRMGSLADSTLGARWLGSNPWLLAAAPAYLRARGTPATPAELAGHACLVYSSVMGDARWQFVDTSAADGRQFTVPVHGPLRSNNLSALLAACEAGLGIAALPWYVAHAAVSAGRLLPVLGGHGLPAQEIHAVFPSPKLVPAKVRAFIDFLQPQFRGDWWAL